MTFFQILDSFFPQKGVGAFIRENTLYISLLHFTGIIATSRWIQFQLPFSVVFWQASPVSVWACEGAELHAPHTKRTCLSRPVVCLNRTLTTFENTMFLRYLRMARWFSKKKLQFSPLPTGWHRLKMSEMVLRYLYEKQFFITCIHVCYLYKLTPTIFFKLVNLVLVMMPLTDHVYFVGIVSKNSPNLLQHAMHIVIFSLNSLAMFLCQIQLLKQGFM